MKIALYYGTFYRNKDGVARTAYQLVEYLLSQGHEVHLWTPEVSKDTIEGIAIHHLPSLPIPLYPSYRFALPRGGFLKEMDDLAPDIIHTSTPDLIGLIIGIHARKRGIPLVSAYHTDFPSYLKYYHLSLFRKMAWVYFRYFYNMCQAVLCPTKLIKGSIEANGIGNVRIWSRGIDIDKFSPSKRSNDLRDRWGAKDRLIVLFTGRFVYYKDIDIVMKVYKLVMKGNLKNKVIFIMIGHGPEEKTLKREMPDAIFPGYLSNDDLYRGYASSDIFMFPSGTETFGNVVQEAIASGLPAIVSDMGGCKEIVEDSGCGIVCKRGDANSFYDALTAMVNNEGMRIEMTDKGQKYVKDRTWKRINQKVLEIYDEIKD